MKPQELFETIGEIQEDYIRDARKTGRKPGMKTWKMLGAAACLCLAVAGGAAFSMAHFMGQPPPQPQQIQIPNPMLEVSSSDEMEEYLGFAVPVLDKEVSHYIVFALDGYASMGQVDYADGSCYRVQYGCGDISGISGGELVETRELEGVEAAFYQYGELRYAIWEEEGFTFSYEFGAGGQEGLEALIAAFQ